MFVFFVRVQKITPVPDTSDQRLTEYDYKVMNLQNKIYYNLLTMQLINLYKSNFYYAFEMYNPIIAY